MDGVVRQALVAVARGNAAREHRADRAVAVAHRYDERDTFTALDRGLAALDQLVIQRDIETVVLHFGLAARALGGRQIEHAGEIQALRLPVLDTGAGVEQLDAPDHFVERADAELGHDLADFFGDEEEVVHDVLGLALELLAQHRILRGDAHRAGIEVALAHHDAAFDDQRRGGEAELVGTEQRADDDIAPGLHLAVGLHADAAAQAVEHQCLLGFSQAELPGRAGVLDRRDRRGAGAAVMTGDRDVVGLGLGNACGHRAHADFGHQLDRDRRAVVDVLQIVDQLCQILD